MSMAFAAAVSFALVRTAAHEASLRCVIAAKAAGCQGKTIANSSAGGATSLRGTR